MNYYVNKILKEKKITTFLEERGIFPVRKSGEKLMYLCPIHAGDSSPSFVVYPEGIKDSDYQTYYCYGCHSGVNIINLKKDIDNTSFRESIKFFLKGIHIELKEVNESIIDEIQKEESVTEDRKKIETLLLLINSTSRQHLLIYNDYEEIEFFEKFSEEVDKVARSRDADLLEKVYKILEDGEENLVKKFIKRQEKNNMSLMAWKI
jgi:DNA primase